MAQNNIPNGTPMLGSSPRNPGFEDYSPEELRHEAYTENAKPHLQTNYKLKERQLADDVRMKIAKLKNPDTATKQQFMTFLQQMKSSTPSAGQTASVFGATSTPAPAASGAAKNAEETLAAIANEVSTWERSGMWLLSEYCSSKESPTIPGFVDVSPDELRYQAYSENPKLHLQVNYKIKERELLDRVRMSIGQLKNPDAPTRQQLIAFLSKSPNKEAATATSFGASTTNTTPSTGLFGKPQTQSPASVFGASTAASAASPFGNAFTGSNNSGTGLFGKAASTATTANAFTGSNSSGTGLFGKATVTATPNAFGTGSNSSGTGLFGKATATATPNAFGTGSSNSGTGLFGKPPSTASTAFGGNAFGKTDNQPSAQQTSAFGSPFGTPAVPAASGVGLFGKPVQQPSAAPTQLGLFGKPSATIAPTITSPATPAISQQPPSVTNLPKCLELYTPLDQLTAAEKAEFEAAEFTLGRVPTRPPAKEHV